MRLLDAFLCDPPEQIVANRAAALTNLALLRRDALTVCQSLPLPVVRHVFDLSTSLEQHVTADGLSSDQLLLLASLASIGVQALHVDALEIALGHIAERHRNPAPN